MKIVKFKDGTFGIRRRFLGFLWYTYAEKSGTYWFMRKTYVVEYCKFEFYLDAVAVLWKIKKDRQTRDYGIPITEEK